jgi:hypothetical protein
MTCVPRTSRDYLSLIPMLVQIVVEAIIALVLGTLGATLRTEELKEISWRSEMKKRCVRSLPLSCLWTEVLVSLDH